MPSSSKTVSFDRNEPKMHKVDKVDTRDINNVWWTPDEYSDFRTSNAKITQAFKKALKDDPNVDPNTLSFCVRGLECLTGNGYLERRNRILEAVCLVLEEQRECIFDGDFDGFSCAERYAEKTAVSRELAEQQGIRDEEAVLMEDLMDQMGLSEEEKRAAMAQANWNNPEEAMEQIEKSMKNSTRAKRRRSSEKRMKGFGISLKNFARRVSNPKRTT